MLCFFFAIFAPNCVKMKLNSTNRDILRIALPAIVSNITVPLLGLVDTSIAGHLGNEYYIGAIAIGGLMFNIMYWIFCFLRWGTSGLTAQALGAGKEGEITNILYRSGLIAIVIGLLLIALQWPLLKVCLWLVKPDEAVAALASEYFYVCIYGAVAVQLLYALSGWFIGMQNSRIPMVIAIVQNAVNIPLSLFFAYVLDLKVVGIALGTVCALYVALALAVVLGVAKYRKYLVRSPWSEVLRHSELVRFFKVNRDIFLRMIFLLAVTTWFTTAGSNQGPDILAANTMLFQMFYLFSFFFDGFANAGEALCGRYWGARDVESFVVVVKRVFAWGLLIVGIFTVVYIAFGDMMLSMLSDQDKVLLVAQRYLCWLVLIPICGLLSFVWDGVFIGATATRHLLLSMAVGTAVFFIAYAILFPLLGNDGLWISFLLYLLGRGLTQCPTFRRVIKPILE